MTRDLETVASTPDQPIARRRNFFGGGRKSNDFGGASDVTSSTNVKPPLSRPLSWAPAAGAGSAFPDGVPGTGRGHGIEDGAAGYHSPAATARRGVRRARRLGLALGRGKRAGASSTSSTITGGGRHAGQYVGKTLMTIYI
jgi:hypothetical protein